jgi:tripartite-type tricarboxylate transporter receptor subunit TctC
MNLSRRQALAALGAAPLALSRPARAATWPTQPLKMSIGYSTGGAADMVGRAMAPAIQKELGQPLIMEYRPGAGGAIAAGFIARAPADGQQIYLADTGSMAIIPNLRQVPYDPVREFTPLSWVGASGLVLLVNPQVPATDVPSLVKLLKARPDAYAYSSSGIGSPHQLAGELFKQMTDTEAKHIAYRGAAPAMNDLMAGQVQIAFATIGPALPLIQAGRVRAIAVTSARRSASLPQVPTIAEQGVAGYDATPWFAVVGPPNLPPAIAARLQSAFATALADKEVIANLEKVGVEDVGPRTPAFVTQAVRDDLAKWAKVIRTADIKLEG